MRGKKGMSPLIATILLMAFAVALGGMIMNWSSTLPDEGLDCSAVKLNIQQFCLADGKLNMRVRNIGEVEIAAITLAIVDPPIKSELEIQDSHLNNGQSLNVEIPFSYSASAEVGIVPVLSDHDEQVACSAPVHEVTGLPNC